MVTICEKFLFDFFENEGFIHTPGSRIIVCSECGFKTKNYFTITHIQFIHKLSHPKCKRVRYLPYKYENYAKSKKCIADYSDAKMCVSATEEMMEATFCAWPKRLPAADKLLLAGFFYTGNSDEVMCVECKVVLDEWEATDDPWTEHQKASPDCLLVKLHKSQL